MFLVVALAVAAKGAFGVLFVLPLAGLTFRELSDPHFGPDYQLKNLLHHLMISTGIALAALGLAPGLQGAPAIALACARLFGALGLVSALLMVYGALQRRLR